MLVDRPLIRDLISPAVAHLHSLDIEPELTVSPYVHDDQLDAFNAEFGLTLPTDVRDIYAETDGFNISWDNGDDWGEFDFPTLYDLRLHRQRWINGDMPGEESTAHLDDEVSVTLLSNMHAWLPFDESGGGDLMCVDCSSGRIVEFDHEWGNLTKRNGTVYATDLHSYIRSCARISFYSVWLVNWDQVLRNGNCWVNWNSAQVPPKYVVGDSGAT